MENGTIHNLVVNYQDADLHTIADESSPAGPVIVLSQETRELIDSSNAILARVNTQQGEFGDRDFDTLFNMLCTGFPTGCAALSEICREVGIPE